MDKMKKPQEEVSAATPELTQTELDKVAGGGTVSPSTKATVSEFVITKTADVASPNPL